MRFAGFLPRNSPPFERGSRTSTPLLGTARLRKMSPLAVSMDRRMKH